MALTSIGYCLQRNPEHSQANHPEHPNRLTLFNQLSALPLAESLHSIPPGEPTETTLLTVHDRHYLEQVKEAVSRAPTRLDAGDTYVTKASWQAACSSAGGAITAAKYGLEPDQVGFSLSRPPGHHANRSSALGFCLFNNIALATRAVQSQGIKRVLIVDFDVHHGNGTQDLFEADPDVFYFSTHQQGIFPGTGYLGDHGLGQGEGTVQNVPLPAYTGDTGYLALFEPLLGQIVGTFKPEAILVSAGYDAHWRDPLAQLQLSCAAYYSIARIIGRCAQDQCAGRLAFFLEGGYDPTALYQSVVQTFYGLLDQPAPVDPLGKAPAGEADISPLLDQLLHP
jgi:acetoin utilization deacetylase AcuC-like enzyme